MQAQWGRRRPRPLRCGSSRDSTGGSGGGRVGGSAGEHVCRICWDGIEAEGNRLVEPCACSGSMRYVHAQCLAHWQQQLRAQKGFAAARRCDICKAPFARAHQLPSGPTHWRLLVRDVLRRVPWPAVLECWKFSVLAIGAVQGMQAGLAGLRSGAQWAAGTSRGHVEGLARWAPEMALAAGTVPPLKVPMALALAAFVTGLAAQVAVVSLVCAYAGSVMGFAVGVSSSLLATFQLGACAVQQGAAAALALAGGAVRCASALGRLAGPLGAALLKALALTRMLA